MAKDITTVRLDPELLRRLDEIAAARDESRSAVIERILWNELKGEEEFVRDMESPVMRAVARMVVGSPAAMRFVIWMAGESIDEDELQKRLGRLREQLELGIGRQRAKRPQNRQKE